MIYFGHLFGLVSFSQLAFERLQIYNAIMLLQKHFAKNLLGLISISRWSWLVSLRDLQEFQARFQPIHVSHTHSYAGRGSQINCIVA